MRTIDELLHIRKGIAECSKIVNNLPGTKCDERVQ
jgi:hypothetical protein